MALYVLYEHAAGYTLFRAKEFEEVGMHLPQVEQSIKNLSKFSSVVQLIAFLPFKNAANALDNINSVSEGILHQDLQLFLETNLPKPSKKTPVTLGVGDAKIGAAIQETLSYSCQHTGVVPEILRGIRLYFPSLVKGLTEQAASKAQLGLGHSYSRAKVKFNINRNDNMIIQSISLLDQLDKDINIFAMRVREWYSYHFPELIKIVPDNYTYAKVTKFIKNRKDLTEEKLDELEELVMDSAKARAIVDAAKASMGMDISPIDLINIEMFASRVIALAEYRRELMEYLKTKMGSVAPNLATLIGETVGARLISHAGSLTNLAKYPSSTIQILGAEKALFRALKTRGNTPKYGLLFHSTFIGRAGAKHKGRISRYLANKCAIASRIDCFSEIPNSVFGTKLREQVEERLKFYETGELPRKNIEVMKDAMEEAAIVIKKIKKKKKKEKKKKLEEQSSLMSSGMENSIANENESQEIADGELASKKQKKKKRKLKEESLVISSGMDDSVAYGNESQEVAKELSTKKQKKEEKKRKLEEQSSGVDNSIADEELTPTKKKKKKRKLKEESSVISSGVDDSVAYGNESQEVANEELSTKKQKKEGKKRKLEEQSSGVDNSIANESQEIADGELTSKKQKKKKRKSKEESSVISSGVDDSVAYGNESQEVAKEELSMKKQKKKETKKKLEEQSSFMSSGVDDSIANRDNSQEIHKEEASAKKKKKKKKTLA